MSQIKYRVSTVSSEHPKYPASNLALNQDGWQSSINCSYPQSLTIQFYIPIRTKKLHVLFHQYKIPRLIEVFVKLGARANYRKLGHVVPNDNLQSSFEEKEQKTLYFQFACTHIRFVLHENYKNDMNIFNQVGIEDLIVIGEILSHKEISGIDLTEEDTSEDQAAQSIEISHNERTFQKKDNEEARPIGNNSSSSSPLFRDIYAKLQAQKEEAVQREEYQKASQIKTILNNFKNLELEISRLEKEKMEALRNQDYDRCHRIKQQINKKKEVVQFQRESLFRNEEQFYSQNSFSRIVERQISPINESKKKQHPSRDLIQFKSPELQRRQAPQKLPTANSHDEQVLPALLNKGKQQLENLPLETNEKRKDLFVDINQSIIPQQLQQDQTSLRKDLNQIRQITEREVDASMINESNIELKPLEMKLRTRVQIYFGFLPQKLWQLCEAKNWRGKLEALKFLKEKILQVETKQHFMGVLEMLSRIIVSKQAVISIQVLQLLNKLTQINIKFTLQHLPFFVEDIINELLNFLNDTNSKIKELAYTTYFRLPKISFLSMNVVIRELIRHKNKVKNDPKLIIIKLQLMTLIIETYKEAEYNFKEIMTWTLVYFEDPNQKVRSTAAELLIALAYLVGSQRLLKAIEDMKKPQLLQMVLNMMNTSFDHSKANIEHSKLSLDNSKLNQQFYGPEIGKSVHSKVANKVPAVQPLYVLSDSKQKMEGSKNSRKDSENANFQLSYSRQSIYEESVEPDNFKSNKQTVRKEEEASDIRVLEDQVDPEDNVCIYCMEAYDDERNHYLEQCKVLAHCQKCNSLIYLREFTEHLLNECEESHMFRACKKCGVALEISEINEHIAKDTCKKKLGVNWERCQFCSCDILAEDKCWIEHALQCKSLPDKKYAKGHDDYGQEDISMEVSQ